jgi:hypothetical protein
MVLRLYHHAVVISSCGRVSGSREKGERSLERAEGVGVGGEGRWSTIGCEDDGGVS